MQKCWRECAVSYAALWKHRSLIFSRAREASQAIDVEYVKADKLTRARENVRRHTVDDKARSQHDLYYDWSTYPDMRQGTQQLELILRSCMLPYCVAWNGHHAHGLAAECIRFAAVTCHYARSTKDSAEHMQCQALKDSQQYEEQRFVQVLKRQFLCLDANHLAANKRT